MYINHLKPYTLSLMIADWLIAPVASNQEAIERDRVLRISLDKLVSLIGIDQAVTDVSAISGVSEDLIHFFIMETKEQEAEHKRQSTRGRAQEAEHKRQSTN